MKSVVFAIFGIFFFIGVTQSIEGKVEIFNKMAEISSAFQQ